jgi:hypothetical protein
MPAKLGHGTHFTSPPKEGMLEDFYHTRLRPGLNPRTRVPEASMLTTRPPKSSYRDSSYLTVVKLRMDYKDQMVSKQITGFVISTKVCQNGKYTFYAK